MFGEKAKPGAENVHSCTIAGLPSATIAEGNWGSRFLGGSTNCAWLSVLSRRPNSPYGDLEDLVELALQQRRL